MKTVIRLSALVILSVLTATPGSAQDLPVRERTNFNRDWRFRKEDQAVDAAVDLSYDRLKPWLLPSGNDFSSTPFSRPQGEAPGEKTGYVQPGLDDSGWRQLNLPHDWGIEGPFTQALPGETGKLPWFGVVWYRKHFDLPAADQGRKIQLDVDGAMSYATVWCNGKFVGGWPYGYASWSLDLTPYVKPGQSNVLAIRLDNPPDSSRWYPGGGIYRNVWLVKTAPVHVARWGTAVSTSNVSEASAGVTIKAVVQNEAASEARIEVKTELFAGNADGSMGTKPVVSFPSATVVVPAGDTRPVEVGTVLEHPQLWDLKTPHLYTAVTTVNRDGRVVDRYETRFGIRTVEFTVNDGMHLNGRRVPIQGVCMHHDLGALGSAFNVRAAERQLEILKEMGVNAIRTSHNPPAPELLDLCDRMGFLVMDEYADCWKLPKKPNGYQKIFVDWSEQDIRAYVRRDRNHPSVVLWSIGNEIPEQSDALPGWYKKSVEGFGSQAAEPPKWEGLERGLNLSRLVHLEDPGRPTTIGVSDTKGGYNGFQKTVDVFGYNYKPKEYGKFHAANPGQPLFASETASTISSRGEYFFPVTDNKSEGKADFQVSSYDLYTPGWATTPDAEFKGQDESPFVAGEFVWTGFDYIGEPTPYNKDLTNLLNYHSPEEKAKAEAELKAAGKIATPSRSSYFGIVDLAGFKKDRFYLYQARWRPDLPMAHILPHWNWPERGGEITPVHVYTSGDEAELFLNGKSLGRKKKGPLEYRLRWDDVKYEPGELKVVVYKGGKEWASDTVKTTGPAAKLLLQPDRASIKADGQDLAFVTLTIADREGLQVPRSKNKIKFEISGPGEIVATDNGDATDHTVFASPERAAFNGLALVIVRVKPGADGPVTLRASAEGLAPAEAILKPQHP